MSFLLFAIRCLPYKVSVILLSLFYFSLYSGVLGETDAYLKGDVKKGWATFYVEWRSNPGSCGVTPTNPAAVCALSSKYMKLPSGMTNPNKHPLCDKRYCVLVRGPLGAAVVKVSDTCPRCAEDNGENLDLADDFYATIAEKDKGKNPVHWKFVDCASYKLGKFTGDLDSEFPDYSSGKSPTTPSTTTGGKSGKKKRPAAGSDSSPSSEQGPSAGGPPAAKKPKLTKSAGKKPIKVIAPVVVNDSSSSPKPVDAIAQEKPSSDVISPPPLSTQETPKSAVDLSLTDPTKNEALKELLKEPEVAALYQAMQLNQLSYLKQIGELVATKKHKKLKVVYASSVKNGNGQSAKSLTDQTSVDNEVQAANEFNNDEAVKEQEMKQEMKHLKDEINGKETKKELKDELKPKTATEEVKKQKEPKSTESRLPSEKSTIPNADDVEVIEIEEVPTTVKLTSSEIADLQKGKKVSLGKQKTSAAPKNGNGALKNIELVTEP